MDKPLFNDIVDFLAPLMSDGEARFTLVTKALYGSPILNSVSWDGNAQFFTVKLVHQLTAYDRDSFDLPSLTAVLNEAKVHVGPSQNPYIDTLITRILNRNKSQTPVIPENIRDNQTDTDTSDTPIQIRRETRRKTNAFVLAGTLTAFFVVMIPVFSFVASQLNAINGVITPTRVTEGITLTPLAFPTTQTPPPPSRTPPPPADTPTKLVSATLTTVPSPTPTYTFTPTIDLLSVIDAIALTPVAENNDWKTIEREFDGVVMVLVPVGCFEMGSIALPDTQPVTDQCFDIPFWIDKYEVTNAQFAAFQGQASHTGQWNQELRPRENVTWFEARDFCILRGGGTRLPTEREWEYAASGPSNRAYPWSGNWDPNNALWRDNSNGQTENVGGRLNGKSWVGALNMSGNVWEWTGSRNMPYPYVVNDGREVNAGTNANLERIMRGGSWVNSVTDSFRSYVRVGQLSTYLSPSVGFRCVRPI